VLRAIKRVLRPGGRLAFLTIHAAPGLSDTDRRRASRMGPVAVAMRSTHQSLLRTAGFSQVEETDMTADYLTTLRGWVDGWLANEAAVRAVTGDDAFDTRVTKRIKTIAAVEEGLIRRSLVTATG